MKVCWLTTVAAPYTIRLFEEIGKQIDLCVVMEDKKEKNRNDEWKIEGSSSFRMYVIDKEFNKRIKELADEYDILVDGYYLSKYGYTAVSEFKKRGKKTVMAADGGIAKNRGFIVNSIMSNLMKRHDYFFSSSEFTDLYFLYYGVKQDKIAHYRFTSLTSEDIKENKDLAQDRDRLRKELGLDNAFVILSVGQPIERKGFDILLNAYLESGLSNKCKIYIIGGKPQEKIKKIVEKNEMDNVFFPGLLRSNELRKYYACADLFVLCTREDIWGLVIQEAMSYGLPVISSDNCVAAEHFAKLDGGVIVCPNEDEKAFGKEIRNVFEDSAYRKALSKKALDRVEAYTIENSAQDIINDLSLL